MIIDAHHHIWRQADLPWLLGPMQPRIFGPYEKIRRDYPVTEYLEDIGNHGIVRSVYVQANWAPDQHVAEADWVRSVALEHGWPHAIVAFADFTSPDSDAQLEALAGNSLVRGIRQQLHWHENPLYRFAARPDLAADRGFQRAVARLADHGWCFELQVFAGQMRHAEALVRTCPDVVFVLQHAGMPEDLSPEGRAAWLDGVTRLARLPNVVCKLSGAGTFVRRNDPELIADIVGRSLELFGPARCMFGSNFPIEKLWTGYGELIDAYKTATSGLSGDERHAIFHDTAARVYRLDLDDMRGNDNGP